MVEVVEVAEAPRYRVVVAAPDTGTARATADPTAAGAPTAGTAAEPAGGAVPAAAAAVVSGVAAAAVAAVAEALHHRRLEHL
ncbi:unnamed protein product [Closterium sp. NIES-54]